MVQHAEWRPGSNTAWRLAQMRIDMGRPSTEPMLWMPDIVAGAAGADRVRGNPQYLDLIRPVVTQLDIPLR